MSESRKNGEQPKDEDHVVALDGDKEFRTSRLSLSKDKSPDGAHEKLLQKEDEVKIVRDMRVDMVDAKYVSGDHRNGDPKIELDANKKQFSGLTKEELMKYADDPFWVNLRWFMFVLFWAMWLGMLAGAITIIVRAPKCATAKPKTYFEKGPLAELDTNDYSDVEGMLPILQSSKIEAIFMEVPTYDALDKPTVVEQFKAFVDKAKEYSIKVIADLTPNYVSIDHPWFRKSENKSSPFADYFVWADIKEFDSANNPKKPNEWVSTLHTSAWTLSEARNAFYLHQFAADQPDLDFNNPAVLQLFVDAITKWMGAGAAGVRLNKARLMVVNRSLAPENAASGRGSELGSGHDDYPFYRHKQTADQPALESLLAAMMAATDAASTMSPEETVFTLKETQPELFMLDRAKPTKLRPESTAPLTVTNATAAALQIDARVKGRWPIMQLKADTSEADKELALFSLLLPAAPVFDYELLDNDTSSGSLTHLTSLRQDSSIEHGHHVVSAIRGRNDETNATGELLACARWKAGHTGYVAVFNPSLEPLRANLTALTSVPATVSVHHASHTVRLLTNYTINYSEHADNVLVPSKSTVVLSYVPETTAEN